MKRRNFILSSLMAAGLSIKSAGNEKRNFKGSPFSLGVASGDCTTDGFVLWTRLAPDPSQPDGGLGRKEIPVSWILSRDPKMKKIVRRGWISASEKLAHSVHIDISDLEPNQVYWYRFQCGDYFSRIGRTKTLPLFNNESDNLKFVTTSCQNYAHGYFVAYDHMIADQPDFILHLGDYIYDTSFGENFRRHETESAPESLEEFRLRHALYKTEEYLQNAHAQIPFFTMIDNHDAVEDNSTETIKKRTAAYQAWYEHMPVRGFPFLGANEFRLHRNIKIGELTEIKLLDSRQFRSERGICDQDLQSSLGFGNFRPQCDELFEKNRTMLGRAQTDWLVENLRNNRASWNVIASPGPFLPFRLENNKKELRYIGAWDAYPENRQEIINAIEISPGHPLVLSGDMHSFWAIDANDDPFLNKKTELIEFVGSSVSANWPEPLSKPVRTNLKKNRQIKFYNGEKRGYFLHELNTDTWVATAKGVLSTKDKKSKVLQLAKFLVEKGKPGFKRIG